MKSLDTTFQYDSLILKSVRPVSKISGLDLIAAKDIKTTKVVPKYSRTAFAPPSSVMVKRTFDYDRLQNHTQSYNHGNMCDFAIRHYLTQGYRVYPRGVGLKQVTNALADFLAEKGGEVLFGECLTKKSIQQPGTLDKKLQFLKYAKICLVIHPSVIALPQIAERLRSVAQTNDVFAYVDVGLGPRENHLVDFVAYQFFQTSSKHLPNLSATIEKTASLVKLVLEFGIPLPKGIKDVEVAETWRMALLHHQMSNSLSFKVPIDKTVSHNGYLNNFWPKKLTRLAVKKTDHLSIRILGRSVEVSTQTNTGLAIFRDRFVPLFRSKGIDKQLKQFVSSIK